MLCIEDPNRFREEVSFILKDTPVDPDREYLGLVILYAYILRKLLSFYQIDRWHRFELLLSACWMHMSCGTLQRSIYLLIKINTLEEVSLLLHVVYSTRCS